MPYERLNLKNGQVFSAEHLVHMEKGIEAANESAAAAVNLTAAAATSASAALSQAAAAATSAADAAKSAANADEKASILGGDKAAYQQLVTDADGNVAWEDRLAYKSGETQVENLASTELTGGDDNGDGTMDGYYLLSPWAADLVAGAVATVTYNGTAYECAVIDYSQFESDAPAGMVAMGNLDAAGVEGVDGSNPDAPFFMVAVANDVAASQMGGMYGMFMPVDGAAAVTLAVSSVVETYKTIDNKYLDLSESAKTADVEAVASNFDNYYTKTEVDTKKVEKKYVKVYSSQSLTGVSDTGDIALSALTYDEVIIVVNLQKATAEGETCCLRVGNSNGNASHVYYTTEIPIDKTIKFQVRIKREGNFYWITQYLPIQTGVAETGHETREYWKTWATESSGYFTRFNLLTVSGNNFPDNSTYTVWGVKA